MNKIFRSFSVLAAASALALSGCGSNAGANADKPNVVASFYPLVFLTQEIAGDAVNVTNLTPSGEAHDVELSAKDLTTISKSKAMIYLSGFQAAVDDAVREAKPKNLLDVAKNVKLVKASEHESDFEHKETAATTTNHDQHDAAQHADEQHNDQHQETDHHDAAAGEQADAHSHDAKDGEEHHHGLYDPHFWLDPDRMIMAIDPIVKTLSEADSSHKNEFQENAKKLRTKLEKLKEEYTTGLQKCQTPTIVVAHEAYGYLAEKFGFKQIGVKGIDPETTTAIKRLEEVAKIATENKVSTLFSESALNDKDVKTLGETLKIQTKVLDPLEVQVDPKQDYLKVMENNLTNLKEAMKCS